MKKTFFLLKNRFPDWNLKLTLDQNVLTFSGNMTPIHLINNFTEVIYSDIENNAITISSMMYPAIYINSNTISLCCGGIKHNFNNFSATAYISNEKAQWLIRSLKIKLNLIRDNYPLIN